MTDDLITNFDALFSVDLEQMGQRTVDGQRASESCGKTQDQCEPEVGPPRPALLEPSAAPAPLVMRRSELGNWERRPVLPPALNAQHAPIAPHHTAAAPALHGGDVWPTDRDLILSGVIKQPVQIRIKGRKCGPPALISEPELAQVLAWIDAHEAHPLIGRVMVLLTMRAGLRPCEVAGLQVRTLLTATGELLDYILVMPGTAKRGRQRVIPMHGELRTALQRLLAAYPEARRIAFRVDKQSRLSYRTIAAVTQWYSIVYAAAGLAGCTSTSGRHSFATELHRLCVPALEIQRLLGHKRLSTTSIYLRPAGVSAAVIGQLGTSAQIELAV